MYLAANEKQCQAGKQIYSCVGRSQMMNILLIMIILSSFLLFSSFPQQAEGLKENLFYQFQVRAMNMAGVSKTSLAAKALECKEWTITVPGILQAGGDFTYTHTWANDEDKHLKCPISIDMNRRVNVNYIFQYISVSRYTLCLLVGLNKT